MKHFFSVFVYQFNNNNDDADDDEVDDDLIYSIHCVEEISNLECGYWY